MKTKTHLKTSDYLPWLHMMEIAFGVLGVPPQCFWDMTPPEFCAAVIGYRKNHGLWSAGDTEMSRSMLTMMQALYPDDV